MSLSPPTHTVEPIQGRPAALQRSGWRRLWWTLRVAQVRLRFPIVLAAAFLIVGKWDALRNYWDTFVAPVRSSAGGGVSSDTEYFCPMCPGVISDWPTKCSVCNMPLVRRKKGEAIHLPDGVVARMQLSPYRVQLAGIRTAAVQYRPLEHEVAAHGVVSGGADTAPPADSVGNALRGVPQTAGGRRAARPRNATEGVPNGSDIAAPSGSTEAVPSEGASLATVDAEVDEHDLPFIELDAAVEITSDVFPGYEGWRGHISAIEREVDPRSRRVKIQMVVDDPRGELWPGMRVSVRTKLPMADLEPFRSQPSDPPPLAEGEPRKLFTCPDHPLVLREKRGTCHEDKNSLVELPLSDLERVGWWCPMHPTVTAGEPGQACEACGGMKLLPRIIRYRPAGQVLAVPESAIVDLGDRRVVYVERMPGMFDGVEVVLGPRCGADYPVIGGLEPGERVAATGAFLLDAETRLNPSVAAAYFGATRSDDTAVDARHHAPHAVANDVSDEDAAAIREVLAELSPTDRESVERQKTCPITGLELGSMGAPLKVEAGGRTVWICCEGCKKKAMEAP